MKSRHLIKQALQSLDMLHYATENILQETIAATHLTLEQPDLVWRVKSLVPEVNYAVDLSLVIDDMAYTVLHIV